jgi:hypothetical protein
VPRGALNGNCSASTDYNDRANGAFNREAYTEVIVSLWCTLKLHTDHDRTLSNIAAAYHNRSFDATTIQDFHEDKTLALFVDPSNTTGAAYYNSIANSLLRPGGFEQAVEYYLRALETDPNDKGPYVGLGTAYFNLGQYEESLASYQSFIDAGLLRTLSDGGQAVRNTMAFMEEELRNNAAQPTIEPTSFATAIPVPDNPTSVAFTGQSGILSCPGLLTSRLIPGEQASVSSGRAINLRENPSEIAQIIDQIPNGAVFDVISGPQCTGEYA